MTSATENRSVSTGQQTLAIRVDRRREYAFPIGSKRQLGQAMPIGIALIMFTILAGIVLHNTGQQVSEKTRLANAADSAVYSGLIWQTRALNFQSYTNRAMVANQVTMAQAVSLRSWTLYGKIAAENANQVLGNIPYVGAVTNAMATVMDMAEGLLSPITEALLSFVNAVNGILSQAQTAMYGATFVATPELVRNVAKKNDSNFNADTAYTVVGSGLNVRDWKNFTEQYKPDNGFAMQRRADIINRSTDRFTRSRDWEFFNNWFYLGPIVRIKMHKRGTTRLVATPRTEQVYEGDGEYSERVVGTDWEWKGKDTLSLNTRIWRPFRSDKKIEAPIGWGQAFANSASGSGSIEESCTTEVDEQTGETHEECDRWFGWNRSAEYMSDNNVRSLSGTESQEKMNATYNGIRAYRDLADLGNQARDPRLVLRVEVESPIETVRTSTKLGFSQMFSAPDAVAKEAMASIASGEVYFKKPVQPHFGGHIEYANLYNPFWDVRLVDTPDKHRLYALMLREVPVLQGAAPAASEALGDYVQTTQNQVSDLQNELETIEAQLADPNVASLGSAHVAELEAQQATLDAQIAGVQQTLASVGGMTVDGFIDNGLFNQSAVSQAQQLSNSLDPSSMQSELENYAQQEFDAFAEQAEEIIKEKIKEELENALTNALMGAVEGATGVDVAQLQGDLESTYDSVNSTVDGMVDEFDGAEEEFNSIMEQAEAETQQVEAEFEAIKLEVAQTFEERKEELEQQAAETLSDLENDVQAIEEQLLNEELLPAEREELEQQLASVQSQIDQAPEDSLLEQAQMLVEVVNSSTDLYQLDLQVALELVSMEGDIGENLEDRLRIDCSEGTTAESDQPDDYQTTDDQCGD